MIRLRLFLGLPVFLAFVLSVGAADDKPNILFIYTDDHSYRTVGCYPESYPWVETPNIDRLAETGVRFTHAYVGTWCMPSRATMLTGLHQYGVESMRMEGQYPGSEYDPAQCRFWPSVFREQGYQTAQIGKWHTGTDTGFGRDWDYQIVWNRPRFPGNSGNYYKDQLIEINGGEAQMVEGADGKPHSKGGKRATGEKVEGKSLEEAVWQYNEGVLAIDEGIGRLRSGICSRDKSA